MRLIKIVLLLFVIISPVNANTIYNLIKIPNLEIYQAKSTNGLKYLKAIKPFQIGVNNNIECLNSNIDTIKEKFPTIVKNFNKYSLVFLKKINLKYIILCEDLSISEINTGGIPNNKMRTLIIDIKFDKNHFERVIHHEIFHIINDDYKNYFKEDDWKKFNNAKFKYADCSTCSNRLNLSLYEKTEGFLTEYSMSTASEDMAEVFSFIMTDKKNIENKVINDTILNKKISFIKNNILKIDNKFSFK